MSTIRELHGLTFSVPSPSIYFLMNSALFLAHVNMSGHRGWYICGNSGAFHKTPFKSVDHAALYAAMLIKREARKAQEENKG